MGNRPLITEAMTEAYFKCPHGSTLEASLQKIGHVAGSSSVPKIKFLLIFMATSKILPKKS